MCACMRVCNNRWNKIDSVLIISGTGVHYIILLLWVACNFSLKVKIKDADIIFSQFIFII